jgi:hypothetical protein
VSSTPLLIAALVLLAAGLVAWAGLAMARFEERVRSLGGFEGLHFEL